MTEQTYWNGMPTPARRGTAIVADSPKSPDYWARPLIGTRIPVVEIVLDFVTPSRGTDYLDDRDGSAWEKVTLGKGGSRSIHASLAIQPGSFTPDTPPTALAAEPHWTAWSPRLTDVTKPAPTYHEAFIAGWEAFSEAAEMQGEHAHHEFCDRRLGCVPKPEGDESHLESPERLSEASDAYALAAARAYAAEGLRHPEAVENLPDWAFQHYLPGIRAALRAAADQEEAPKWESMTRGRGDDVTTYRRAHGSSDEWQREPLAAAEPVAIVEIDWAEDRAGKAIEGPVGPFYSEGAADRWAQAAIYNGEWNTAQLKRPARLAVPDQEEDNR